MAEPILKPEYAAANYNEEAKTQWKNASMRFFRAVAKDLRLRYGLQPCDASFNPGGIAVSGDAGLLGFPKLEKGQPGIEVRVNIDGICAGGPGKVSGYYRRVTCDPERNPRYPVGQMGVNNSVEGLFHGRQNGISVHEMADVFAQCIGLEKRPISAAMRRAAQGSSLGR